MQASSRVQPPALAVVTPILPSWSWPASLEPSFALGVPAPQGEEEEPSAPLEGTGLTQFELLEASAPTQALPSGPLGDSLNRQTLAFVG